MQVKRDHQKRISGLLGSQENQLCHRSCKCLAENIGAMLAILIDRGWKRLKIGSYVA
jgi:hypothetical protein